ncbi:hypothetical protein K491DRAFT_612396, partial [Lophiostoma macrostomum CBS 122681]
KAPKRKLPKPLTAGIKQARFDNNNEWDNLQYRKIGTSTRKIVFGYQFVLKDDHIHDLPAMGKRVCENLTDFVFKYGDVSYDAHNGVELKDDAVVLLAKSCPNLKVVQLQDIYSMTDVVLLAFLGLCPKLTSLELTGNAQKFSTDAMEEMQEHPEWAPKLKKLLLPSCGDSTKAEKEFMKEMRNLTRERRDLFVTLVGTMQVKKWGDWELTVQKTHYQRGHKTRKFKQATPPCSDEEIGSTWRKRSRRPGGSMYWRYH